jgi:hypothetical protein
MMPSPATNNNCMADNTLMNDPPSTTVSDGRGADGRFGKGNTVAKGNPHARRVARLRSALMRAVTPDDLRDVVAALLRQAKTGDVPAVRELMQRLLGPPESLDLIERLDALEAKINQISDNKEQSWRR